MARTGKPQTSLIRATSASHVGRAGNERRRVGAPSIVSLNSTGDSGAVSSAVVDMVWIRCGLGRDMGTFYARRDEEGMAAGRTSGEGSNATAAGGQRGGRAWAPVRRRRPIEAERRWSRRPKQCKWVSAGLLIARPLKTIHIRCWLHKESSGESFTEPQQPQESVVSIHAKS